MILKKENEIQATRDTYQGLQDFHLRLKPLKILYFRARDGFDRPLLFGHFMYAKVDYAVGAAAQFLLSLN